MVQLLGGIGDVMSSVVPLPSTYDWNADWKSASHQSNSFDNYKDLSFDIYIRQTAVVAGRRQYVI